MLGASPSGVLGLQALGDEKFGAIEAFQENTAATVEFVRGSVRGSRRRALATLPSTRRSDEISLAMKAKCCRSRSWNSGTMRMPSVPQTTWSPFRTSRNLRQLARVLDRRLRPTGR